MIKEWRKFKGWLVLEYFLRHPNTQIHIKGLARALQISPGTTERYLKLYEKTGILEEKTLANSRHYSLKNDDSVVRELKKLWFLLFLKEHNFLDRIIKNNENVVSVALFGTYAKGEYSEKSDVDFLVISQSKALDTKAFKELEEKLHAKVEVTKLSLGEWRRMLGKGSAFSKNVLKSHLVLYGGGL